MTKEKQLSLAIKIACDAHWGQFDKIGKPYILHPLWVMGKLLYDTQLATIAVLHDVVEDAGIKLDKFEFSDRVLVAVDLLTHKPGVSYEEYIRLVGSNWDALRVKRKDLEHNSSIIRLKGIEPKDIARMEKYHKAFLLLEEAKHMFG